MSEVSVENQSWVVLDLETTNLVPAQSQILECAVIHVRPEDLAVLSASRWLVTHGTQGDMPPFVQQMHTTNGLLADLSEDRIFLSESGQLLADAHSWFDTALSAHFARINSARHSIVLVGNSIHFDRSFLQHHCPAACMYLHHRMIDVSCLRTLYKAWGGELPVVASAHRAMPDCEASLQSLRWYARSVFRNDKVPA